MQEEYCCLTIKNLVQEQLVLVRDNHCWLKFMDSLTEAIYCPWCGKCFEEKSYQDNTLKIAGKDITVKSNENHTKIQYVNVNGEISECFIPMNFNPTDKTLPSVKFKGSNVEECEWFNPDESE